MKQPTHAPPTAPRPAVRSGGWLAALLVAVILAVFARTLGAGFIWDDDAHLTANACIVGPEGLKEVWTTPAANYFPLVLTHLWVLHAIGGLVPWPYHLANILLHAMAALVLWRVLRELEVPWAWGAALAWAVHPVQVESVAWISEMKNTQSGLFYLLASACFVRWLRRDATPAFTRRYAGAVVFALLALLSKPSTVMLPVALLLCAWWIDPVLSWKRVRWLAPFFLLSAVVSGWTIWEQKFHSGALGPEWNVSLLGRLLIAGRAIWFYLGKLLWPADLAFIYPRWSGEASSAAGGLAWLGLVAAAAFLVSRRRQPAVRAGWFAGAYFVALLFPVLGFFDVYFFRYAYVSDHFQYLASIGPIVGGVVAVKILADALRPQPTWLVPALGAFGIAVLGTLSFRQTRIYADERTLWQCTVRQNPACWLGRLRLGMMAIDAGDSAEALAQLSAALQLRPNDPDVYVNLGNALLQANRVPEARQAFEQALRLKPDSAEAHCNLGNAYAQTNQVPAAIQCYEAALRLNPKFVVASMNLGSALFRSGRVAEAIPRYENAVRWRPNYAEAHSNLGSALLQVGRVHDAIGHYEAALRIKPAYPDAETNLGLAWLRAGRTEAALGHFRRAVAMAPNHLAARCQLGLTLAGLGQRAEAIEQLQAALQLQPDLPEARNVLAQLQGGQPAANPAAR